MASDFLWFTGLCLGIRHGFDLDHVTAIADLVGTKLASDADIRPSQSAQRALKYQACWLAAAYAGGHAAVVAALGLSALFFRASLPSFIDPIMEKVVGLTLVVLGTTMLVSVITSATDQPRLRSRGMLILSAFWQVQHWIDSKLLKKSEAIHRHESAQLCNWRCAASIGALHGIGAETGTQVLLIASLYRTGSPAASIMMLSSFVLGMLLSNLTLAFMLSEGYSRLLAATRWLALIAAVVAITSIVLGFIFLFGYSAL